MKTTIYHNGLVKHVSTVLKLTTFILLFLVSPLYTQENISENSILSRSYHQYVKEVNSQIKRDDNFRLFWEKEFTKAIEKEPTAATELRLCVLGELGAIQKGLGATDRAVKTFEKMVLIAKEAKDIRSEAESLGDVFLLYCNDIKTEKKFANYKNIPDIAKEFSRASTELFNAQKEEAGVSGHYFSTMYDIGGFLCNVAGVDFISNQEMKLSDDQKNLLDFSEECLAISVTEHNINSNQSAERLFKLAKVESALEKHDQAVATYAKILKLKQNQISALWIQELMILESDSYCSSVYIDKIQKILTDFNKSGNSDSYKQHLNYRLAGCLAKQGDYENSNKYYSYAMEGITNDNLAAYILTLMATNYTKLGNKIAAQSLLDEAKKKYPNSN